MLLRFALAFTLALSVSAPTLALTTSATSPLERFYSLGSGDKKDESYEMDEQAFYLLIKLSGLLKDDRGLYRSYDGLGSLYTEMERYPEAETAYRKGIEAITRARGGNDACVGIEYSKLAAVYVDEERNDLAESASIKAVEILRHKTGQENQIQLAAALHNQAWLEASDGRFAKAVQDYRQSIQILKRICAMDNPLVGLSENNLAEIYAQQGNFAESERWYQLALHTLQKTLGDPAMTYAVEVNYAKVLRAEHKDRAASILESEAKASINQSR